MEGGAFLVFKLVDLRTCSLLLVGRTPTLKRLELGELPARLSRKMSTKCIVSL